MSKRKQMYGLIAAVMIIAAALMTYIPASSVPIPSPKQTERTTTISIWVFSKGWDSLVSEFQKQHPDVVVDVRGFRSSEQLYTELLASISANAAPQLAEIRSFYGISGLVSSGAAVSVDDIGAGENLEWISALSEPFRYSGKLWAIPTGGSLPVVFYRDELMKRTGEQKNKLDSWNEIERAAALPVPNLNQSASGLHWGLTVDNELPWYLENIARLSGYDQALAMWKGWVDGLSIMAPLTHKAAASDFINGKTGVFISSSDKLPTIERFVGGKFIFALSAFPGAEAVGMIPAVNGVALLQASPVKQKAAANFLSFLTLEQSQIAVWRSMGLIPARADVAERLQEENSASFRQKMILDSVRWLVPHSSSVSDLDVWTQTSEKLEKAELQAGESISGTGG